MKSMSATPDIAPENAGEPARSRLIQAAASCFAERGYSGTSVRNITAKADCSAGICDHLEETPR